MELIDIGVNLTARQFAADREKVIRRAREAGVERMIVTGTSVAASRAAAALAEAHPGVLYATAGVHPHSAKEFTKETGSELRKLAARPGVVSIGETGLDFNRMFSPKEAQLYAFEAQVELAIELGLPLFLHQRDAHEDFLAILDRYKASIPAAVVHCFTDHAAELRDYLAFDFVSIGQTGWICDERRGVHLRELIRGIPADRLMVETDAPWITPRTLQPKPPGGRNEPGYLPHIVEEIAHWAGKPAVQLAAETTRNAEQFFRLQQPAQYNSPAA